MAKVTFDSLRIWSIKIITVASILGIYYVWAGTHLAMPGDAFDDIIDRRWIVGGYFLFVLFPIHHLVSVIPSCQWKDMPENIDVVVKIMHHLLLVLEITTVACFVTTLVKASLSNSFNIRLYFMIVLTGVLLAAFFILWIGKTLALVGWAMNLTRECLKKWGLLRDHQRPKIINGKSRPANQYMAGGSIWKIRFAGEAKLLTSSRVLFAFGFFLFMVIHSINEIIINPVDEVDSAATVTTHQLPLNPLSITGSSIVTQGGCSVGSPLTIVATRSSTPPEVIQRAVSLKPDPSVSTSDYLCTSTSLESLPQSIFITCWPDVGPSLITVNYSMFDMKERISDSVHILIGILANGLQTTSPDIPPYIQADDYVQHMSYYTEPTVLLPGYNLLGQMSYYLRQIPSRWTLFNNGGITVPVLTVGRLYPDASPSIPRSENISTLRFFCPIFDREIATIQRSKAATLVGGFSAAGGLWTIISGFFGVIFGQSLLHILLGVKPLSFFGIAHRFQREQLRETLLKKYPNLFQKESDRGIVDLLRDYAVELDLVKGENIP